MSGVGYTHDKTASYTEKITSQEVIQIMQFLTKGNPVSESTALSLIKECKSAVKKPKANAYHADASEAFELFLKRFPKEMKRENPEDCHMLKVRAMQYCEDQGYKYSHASGKKYRSGEVGVDFD
jgi:hypothetical protein